MKTNLSNFYQTNQSKVDDGVWFYLNSEETIGFKIKKLSSRNKKFKAFAAELAKKKGKRVGKMSEEEEEKLFIKNFVSSCISDWKGLIDENDTPIPFSLEMAQTIFLSGGIDKELLDDIVAFSQDHENYIDEELSQKELEELGN